MFWLPEPSFKALWQHLACTEFGSCRILLLHCTSCMSCMYHPGLNCSVNCQARHSTRGIPFEALWPHLACTEFSSRRVVVLGRTSCMYLPEAMGRHTVPVQACTGIPSIFSDIAMQSLHIPLQRLADKKMLGRTASQREERHA